jgi:hypothetical protein
MVNCGYEMGLTQEPLAILGHAGDVLADHLYSDKPVKRTLPRAINHTHPPNARNAENLVIT